MNSGQMALSLIVGCRWYCMNRLYMGPRSFSSRQVHLDRVNTCSFNAVGDKALAAHMYYD